MRCERVRFRQGGHREGEREKREREREREREKREEREGKGKEREKGKAYVNMFNTLSMPTRVAIAPVPNLAAVRRTSSHPHHQ
jgi:hypothetical protein